MVTDKDAIEAIHHRISNLERTKAGAELVTVEFQHIKEGLDEVKLKIDKEHSCINLPLIENLETQLRDNANNIKKLYVWQASVGISLLVFFLTIGIAALRFVDSIDDDVKANEIRLVNIEEDSEKRQDSNKKLTEALLTVIKSHADKK